MDEQDCLTVYSSSHDLLHNTGDLKNASPNIFISHLLKNNFGSYGNSPIAEELIELTKFPPNSVFSFKAQFAFIIMQNNSNLLTYHSIKIVAAMTTMGYKYSQTSFL